jgi:hypothetical protein
MSSAVKDQLQQMSTTYDSLLLELNVSPLSLSLSLSLIPQFFVCLFVGSAVRRARCAMNSGIFPWFVSDDLG